MLRYLGILLIMAGALAFLFGIAWFWYGLWQFFEFAMAALGNAPATQAFPGVSTMLEGVGAIVAGLIAGKIGALATVYGPF